jgi:hypothetical protein
MRCSAALHEKLALHITSPITGSRAAGRRPSTSLSAGEVAPIAAVVQVLAPVKQQA